MLGVYEANRIYCGDCLEALQQIPDGVFQTCVTSPPYWGLRDYGIEPQVWGGDIECDHVWGGFQTGRVTGGGDRPPDNKWLNGPSLDSQQERAFCLHCNAWLGSLGLEPTPGLFVQHLVEIFREVRRVLRDDGTLWLNLGSSYWGGKGKSGYELPHEVEERGAKGETLQAGHNVPGYMDMRPADGKHPVFKPKDLVPIPWMVAMALQRDGWWLRSDIIWHKPNPMPESVTDRPTKSHEYLFLLAKSKRYFYDADAVREAQAEDSIRAYQRALASPRTDSDWKQNIAVEHLGTGPTVSPNAAWSDGTKLRRLLSRGRNRRTVWKANPQIWRLKAELSDDDRLYVLGELVRRGLLPSNPSNNDDLPE